MGMYYATQTSHSKIYLFYNYVQLPKTKQCQCQEVGERNVKNVNNDYVFSVLGQPNLPLLDKHEITPEDKLFKTNGVLCSD